MLGYLEDSGRARGDQQGVEAPAGFYSRISSIVQRVLPISGKQAPNRLHLAIYQNQQTNNHPAHKQINVASIPEKYFPQNLERLVI